MTLPSGATLGPYTITGLLGTGGMGEVYRGRDQRLGREVAIKRLPLGFSDNPERLQRFEQEARAIAKLSHPNIVQVFDLGFHEGAPYMVMERVEGQSLRELMGGKPLSPRRVANLGSQVAEGLGAAHQAGIVHRDLKPENLIIQPDGRVKILDFGLAKALRPSDALTGGLVPLETQADLVLGTVPYMSPEQVTDRPLDGRSDLFSLGTILWEMLAGYRPFQGAAAVEVMHAIHTGEVPEFPPELSVPPALVRIVRRCLEHRPEDRFQTASDLAFALASLSDLGSASGAHALSLRPARRKASAWVAGGAAGLLLLGLGWLLPARPSPIPTFNHLTRQEGNLLGARFTPDGQSVVYSASFGDRPAELYSVLTDGTQGRSLGLRDADLLSISGQGEMALLLRSTTPRNPGGIGTLAQVPLAGGAPRELLADTLEADWMREGSGLAVIRRKQGEVILEWPLGRVRHQVSNRERNLSSLRISPDGRRLAFLELPVNFGGLGPGAIRVLEAEGPPRTLAEGIPGLGRAIAWLPDGERILFKSLDPQGNHLINALDLKGRIRLLDRLPIQTLIHDVSRQGDALLELARGGTYTHVIRNGEEQDLSWEDGALASGLEAKGRSFLFTEVSSTQPRLDTYLRSTSGGPPTRLGEGFPLDLSPDGNWVLVSGARYGGFALLPTGVGELRPLPLPGLALSSAAVFRRDGKAILFSAFAPGEDRRGYSLDLDSRQLRPITPFGLNLQPALSPDGTRIAAMDGEGRLLLVPLDGSPIQASGIQLGNGYAVLNWAADGEHLFIARTPGPPPCEVFRISLKTHQRTLWKQLHPKLPGVTQILRPLISPDGEVCVYAFRRVTHSELVVMKGLK